MAFSVICDARKGASMGVNTLVLCDQKISPGIFWTSDDSKKVMRFRNKSVASAASRRFKFNNCRVVDYEEALGIIHRQFNSVRGFSKRVGLTQTEKEVDDNEFNR